MGFPKLFFAHVDDESISQVCFLLMLTTRAFPKIFQTPKNAIFKKMKEM